MGELCVALAVCVTWHPPNRYFFLRVVPAHEANAMVASVISARAAVRRLKIFLFISLGFYMRGMPPSRHSLRIFSGQMEAWISPMWALRR